MKLNPKNLIQNKNHHLPQSASDLSDEMIISDENEINVLLHDKKREILEILIDHEETIKNLSDNPLLSNDKGKSMNPGTVKRHLDALLEIGVIKKSRTEKNEYGIKLIYYRAVASKYIVQFQIPKKSSSRGVSS